MAGQVLNQSHLKAACDAVFSLKSLKLHLFVSIISVFIGGAFLPVFEGPLGFYASVICIFMRKTDASRGTGYQCCIDYAHKSPNFST